MFIPTTVKLVLYKNRPNKEGLVPIVLRFIQNRKVHNIYLRKYIPVEAWENSVNFFVKEKGTGAIKSGKALNHFLNEILHKAKSILMKAEADSAPLTFDQFREQMISTKNQDFLEFCKAELDRRLDSGKFSSETIRNHRSKLNKLRQFKPNLKYYDLTPQFLHDYERHMRVELGNSTNTIFTAMKFLRTMLNAAKNQGLTDVYPFSIYKLVYKKNTRNRLYASEVELLQKIYDSNTLGERLQKVLRHFLFVCYTGLSWKDLANLDYSEIKDLNGVFVINKKRNKTDIEFTVALLEEAKELIKPIMTEGIVFPNLVSNQKANKYIKEVIQGTSIKKHITFHCGRHSFGTISLNKGIPREVVQKMMGHVKPEMTDLYSKVLDSYIVTEMDKWNNGAVSSKFQRTLSNKTMEVCKSIRTMVVANRITSGVSELDIAKKIGVSENDYKKMEKGEIQLGIGYLVEICGFLKLDVKRLF